AEGPEGSPDDRHAPVRPASWSKCWRISCLASRRNSSRRRVWGSTSSPGRYGRIRTDERLPLLLGQADRPILLGHRITPRPVIALADHPEPLRVRDARRD
ncbi:MAG: 2,3-bisphosphoglycerate-independent phosphoglycerate mutase, partial [Trebonia sp.]|nr:2,3-bisphosphoglycerate-independent phosphoglycerate mutase [Trebonia sp.]